MKKVLILFTFLAGIIYLSTLIIPYRSNTLSELHIASDYLQSGDAVLFKDFAEKHKVKVVIHAYKADELIGYLRNHTYDSGIDLLLFRSLHSALKFSKSGLLHEIGSIRDTLDLPDRVAVQSQDIVLLGYDPYVFMQREDSLPEWRTYGELNERPFITELNHEELVPLLASVMPKLRKARTFQWIRDFERYQHYVTDLPDTALLQSCLLTTMSKYIEHKKSYKGPYKKVFFPNQEAEGLFYDARSAGIVKQAENYVMAARFIQFFTREKHNRILAGRINVAPLSIQDLRIYRRNPAELLRYYTYVERIVKKVSN